MSGSGRENSHSQSVSVNVGSKSRLSGSTTSAPAYARCTSCSEPRSIASATSDRDGRTKRSDGDSKPSLTDLLLDHRAGELGRNHAVRNAHVDRMTQLMNHAIELGPADRIRGARLLDALDHTANLAQDAIRIGEIEHGPRLRDVGARAEHRDELARLREISLLLWGELGAFARDVLPLVDDMLEAHQQVLGQRAARELKRCVPGEQGLGVLVVPLDELLEERAQRGDLGQDVQRIRIGLVLRDQLAEPDARDRRVAAGLEPRIARLRAAVHPALTLADVRRALAGAVTACPALPRLRATADDVDRGRVTHRRSRPPREVWLDPI